MFLSGTSDLVRVTTGSAGDIEVQRSYADVTGTPPTVTVTGTPLASITTATTTTVVPSPAASHQIKPKYIGIFNNHASVSNLVTVEETDGTNVVTLWKGTLAPGESVIYKDETGWVPYDAVGLPKSNTFQAAVQADMEAATSVTVAVTPGRQHFHPGHPKCWGKTTVAAGTPTMVVSYNMTSITDTATGELTWTIATDFSSANWVFVGDVERTSTAGAIANDRRQNVRNATQAAGTVIQECWDGTATTNVLADPTAWHMVGLGDQ